MQNFVLVCKIIMRIKSRQMSWTIPFYLTYASLTVIEFNINHAVKHRVVAFKGIIIIIPIIPSIKTCMELKFKWNAEVVFEVTMENNYLPIVMSHEFTFGSYFMRFHFRIIFIYYKLCIFSPKFNQECFYQKVIMLLIDTESGTEQNFKCV